MRVIISGGGTAGHINPAIAIADEIKKQAPDTEIVFVGTKNGMENKLVTLAGYPIWQLDTVGIKRSASFSNIKAVFKTARAVKKAKQMLIKFRPDAVIGTGGYVCFPIIKAASKMGIYTVLHESNAAPGLAVKMLKRRVSKVFVSFDECKKSLGIGDKCVNVGNPVKNSFEGISRDEARKRVGMLGKYRYLIVSFGGSLGAQTVNEIALEIMTELTSRRSDIMHVHACGKNGSGEFFESFKRLGLDKCRNIAASEYIYDMPVYLKAADIAICRSGAMTLAELAAAKCPSVLVPSPNVTGNHQYINASAYQSASAAFLIDEQKNGAVEHALECVKELLSNQTLRKEMAKNAGEFAKPNASSDIVREIQAAINLKG